MSEMAAEAQAETYQNPADGWTCFHCGETFTTVGAARDHFGNDPLTDAACRIKVGEERGLVMALRRAEEELGRYRAEDSDKDREFYRMADEHRRALIREEEKGYNRGVEDMRAEWETKSACIEALERENERLRRFIEVAHDACADPTRPRQSIGEILAAALAFNTGGDKS